MTAVEQLQDRLSSEFARLFPEAVAPCVVRAPGRVNLIGEHLDYNGLPVLPMTIDRSIHVAFAPRRDAEIRLSSLDGRYSDVEFTNGKKIPPSQSGAWENYVKAAVVGLNAHFAPPRHVGMDLLVTGDIPSAAGLSSSSALVVAAALAYMQALEQKWTKTFGRCELAALLAEAEHYTGTRGGGMDQAVILMGGPGAACRIDFAPLRAECYPLPDDFVFVLCNSLVRAEKSGNALQRYNAGPAQCRLIRALAEQHLREEIDPDFELGSLGELWYGPLCLTSAEVNELFASCFPNPRTTLAEAARRLRLPEKRVREDILCGLEEPSGGYPLQARARHVLTEFGRVEAARDALLADDAEAFGELMNASHRSCAEDYAVSCPELDTLVEAARASGAIGARLTGAGFGGCTVNLVHMDDVEQFSQRIASRYYAPDGPPPHAIVPVVAAEPAG